MVGLTYTPPLLPSVSAPVASGIQQSAVVSVLSARAPAAIQDSLANTLREATSPGNILTGEVTAATEGKSFTVTANNGTQVTLPYPPQVSLAPGSTVALRISLDGPTPQATLLSIDGRPVMLRVGSGGGEVATPTPDPSVLLAPRPTSSLPGTGSASAYAASLAASISLEDEEAIELTLTAQDPSIPDNAAELPAELIGEPLLATLIRAAPTRLGQPPLQAGTQYLLTIGDSGELGIKLNPSDVSAWLEQSTPDGAGNFTQQSALLAGRVLAPRVPGETLVETALGTIALAVPLGLPPGAPIRLRIAAVAPPPASAATDPSMEAETLPEEVLQALADGPSVLLEQFLGALLLPTDHSLLAATWKFLTDTQRKQRIDTLAAAIRQQLTAGGKTQLAEKLALATRTLGQAATEKLPDGWVLTSLPFFGTLSREPVRVFTKSIQDEAQQKGGERPSSGRVVVEVTLQRLGPMQFDGLVRDRRFDMVLRTEEDLESDLKAEIGQGFFDTLSQCSWGGDIAFGRIGKFPLVQAEAQPQAITLSA